MRETVIGRSLGRSGGAAGDNHKGVPGASLVRESEIGPSRVQFVRLKI